MRRLRICQLITELRPAGAERCVYELACRLDRSLFDVQVAALRGGQVADMLRDAGVKVFVLGVRGKWDLPKLPALARLLRSERIDLLHTHLFHADLAGRAAAWLACVPRLVHTVHVAEGRFRPWQFAFARLLAGSCDRIVCVSQAVWNLHARKSGLPSARYTVIPNGIDADAFSRDDEARRRLRSEWNVADDEVLFAFVGRLDRQKGIDTLLEAMGLLGRRGELIRLVVAGDGPKRKLLSKFIAGREGTGCVRALGFVDDVPGVLSAADAMVMPSRWEGLPLASVEAMAAGLPVLATRTAGLEEVVADGETGILVEPDDPPALAEVMVHLAGDVALRMRLGSAGRRRVVERFNIDANVAAHELLYAEVAADLLRG